MRNRFLVESAKFSVSGFATGKLPNGTSISAPGSHERYLAGTRDRHNGRSPSVAEPNEHA